MLRQVRKTRSWPRSWANFSLLLLSAHRNARANLHLLGQPNIFLAPAVLLPVRLPGVPGGGRALLAAEPPLQPDLPGLAGPPRRADRRGAGPDTLEDALCVFNIWSAEWLNWSIVTRAHAPQDGRPISLAQESGLLDVELALEQPVRGLYRPRVEWGC